MTVANSDKGAIFNTIVRDGEQHQYRNGNPTNQNTGALYFGCELFLRKPIFDS